MRNSVVMAATMTVATGLGLWSPLAAVAQTPDNPPSDGAAAAPAPELSTIPVAARDADAPPEPKTAGKRSRQIEEIVVTARRTAESMQDVPVAISAFSAEDLRREQINTAQDLQGRVPSMSISPNGHLRSTESVTVRGQGQLSATSPGVVIYYAEVPVPANRVNGGQGGPGKFFDLSNMQVLKGSQGTLFGRNTTGGALLLEPRKPEERWAASLKQQLSNYSGNTMEGIVNAPLMDDRLLVRVAAQYVNRRGFTTDVATGKDYDDKHYWTSRLGLTWKLSDRAENYLLGYYTLSRNNGTSQVVEGFNPSGLNYGILFAPIIQQGGSAPPYAIAQPMADAANVGCSFFNAMAPSSNCGADIVAEQRARGPRRVQLDADPSERLETGGVIDQFQFALNDALTLRNIFSYSFYKHQFRWDLDGSRAQISGVVNPDDVRSADSGHYTEELQLQGTALDEHLRFAIGGYYEDSRPEGPEALYPEAVFNTIPAQDFAASQRSYAPYAQGTYDLGGVFATLEGLNLTAGVRYTVDRGEGRSNAGGSEHSGSYSKSVLTYTVGLDQQVGSSLLYGKISRGYKAGGFSTVAVTPANYTYKPEFVTNYELGHKSDFMIGEVPLRLNSALFYTDYTDMQRVGVDSYAAPGSTRRSFGSAIFSAGRASIAGFETDILLQPFAGLSLMANYSFLDGVFDEYKLVNNGINPHLDCTGQYIERGGTIDMHCIPFQYTPKHQASFTLRYELPTEIVHGTLDGALSYAWRDRQYSAPFTRPEVEPGGWLEAVGLLNASLSWTRPLGDKSVLDVRLFGTNLTDEEHRVSGGNVWNFLYVDNAIYGEPRMVGLEIGYHWGE